jgi:hypothetical protein
LHWTTWTGHWTWGKIIHKLALKKSTWVVIAGRDKDGQRLFAHPNCGGEVNNSGIAHEYALGKCFDKEAVRCAWCK